MRLTRCAHTLYGFLMGKHTTLPSPKIRQDVCERYANGGDLLHISKELGLSYYQAKRSVVLANIQLRPRSEVNTLRRPHIDHVELRRILGEAKLLHHETATHFGVSVSTLTRVMRSLGYRSVKGHGSPMERNHFWKGGRTMDSDGYVLVKAPEHPHANNHGYVREHRLVMEKKLGRYLLPTEVVHHRNDDGDKADNAPSNLELYDSNGDHIREHIQEGSIPRCPTTGRLVKKLR